MKVLPVYGWWLIAALILDAGAVSRIATGHLNQTTGFLFLAAVCATIWAAAEFAIRHSDRLARRRLEIRLLLATISVLLPGLELGLRLGMRDLATYFERNGSPEYVSHYDQTKEGWFLTHPTNLDMRWSSLEFTHVRRTNSLGLSEVEFDTTKTADEFRIIALGDSFTEGVGTTYDSTWVKAAEHRLQTRFADRTIRLLNAGISASDAYYGYVLLRERLLAFQPDLVVVVTNSTDISDIIIRGGIERFRPDGSLMQPDGPAWEWLFAISYICRAVMYGVLDYNWLLIPERQMPARSYAAAHDIGVAIDSVAALGRRHGFAVVAVVHPVRWEAMTNRRTPGVDTLIADLRASRVDRVVEVGEYLRTAYQITTETAADYYWPVDTHFNAAGYQIMGEAIAEAIQDLIGAPGRP